MADLTSAHRDTRIDEAVAEYLRAEQAGSPLDPIAWLSSHPDLRPELDQFLADRSSVRAAFVRAVADPAADPAGFEPGMTFDGLRIVRLIAVGGMGRVYEAVQLALDRPVAVKTVRLTGTARDPQLRHWFQDEMRTVGRLVHDHVVPVYKAGERAGVPYLVMPLMAGTLRDRLAAGPLPPAEVAAVVGAVARAVEYAHGERVLHRDIKPSNVLFDARGRPHLGDFGLTTLLATFDPSGLARVGTPAYMAPEQFDGRADLVSERTDVYGLGAVLYECLTGRPPLPADATAWAEPPPPRQVNPAADRRLEATCLRCLACNPADRYPSAAALAADLDRYLRRPSRRMFLAGGVAAVAAAGGGGVWAWRATRAARDERYQQLVAEIRGRAESKRPGWTWALRAAVAEAASIDTPARDDVFLRTELARAFAHPDLRELGSFAPGPKYEVTAFRPGTSGNEIALGACLRDRDADVAAPVRVALFDRRADRITRTWDLPFVPTWERRRDRTDGVRGLAFTPDGRWLFAGTRSGGIYVIDLSAPDAKPAELAQDAEAVKHLFPAADGRAVVSVAWDGRLRRFALAGDHWRQEQEVAVPTPWPRESWPLDACLLPWSGDIVVLTHRGNGPWETTFHRFTADLVELDDRRLGPIVRLPAPHPHAPVGLADHDGLKPVRFERLLDTDLYTIPSVHFIKLPTPPEQVRFSPDGRVLITACDGPSAVVKFWDAATLAPLGERPCPDGSGQVVFAPDAPLLTVAAKDRVYLFEWAAGGPEQRIGWHDTAVEAVGVSADESIVRTATATAVHAWHPADGTWRGSRFDLPPTFRREHPRTLPAVGPAGYAVLDEHSLGFALTDDRPPRRLSNGPAPARWCVTPDGTYWEVRDRRLALYTPTHQARQGPEAANAPDAELAMGNDPRLGGEPSLLTARGRRALVVTYGRAATVEAEGPLAIREAGAIGGPPWTAAAFTPDGGAVAVGDADGRIGLARWPAPCPQSYLRVHEREVTVVACPAPSLVVSGGPDGTVALLRADGDRLTLISTLPLGRAVVALACEGNTLAVHCQGERAARVWRLDRLAESWAEAGVPAALGDRVRPGIPPGPWPERPPLPPGAAGPGLRRDVYWYKCWEGCVDTRVDPSLTHDWGDAGGPEPVPGNRWVSVVWSGSLTPPAAGRYRFRVSADDAATLYLADRQVLAATPRVRPVGEWAAGEADLPPGPRGLRLEYTNWLGGAAHLRVEWSKPGPGGFDWRPIDPKYLSPHLPK